jgi:cystathionine gamma-lyase
MRGFGGMVTMYLQGGLKESQVFLENLKLFRCAESLGILLQTDRFISYSLTLGAVESLAELPAIMTHASVPPEQRVLAVR